MILRRGLAPAVLAAWLFLIPAGVGFAQPMGNADLKGPPFVLTMIGPGVYAAINQPGSYAGSNAGFIVGDDGVVVVDAFSNPDVARYFLGEIRKITPKPIRFLINTHYHGDHVVGDAVFHDAGAVIVAHRNVRGWIHAENIRLFGGDKLKPETRAQIEAVPTPDLVTSQPLTIWLGARRVEVLPRAGHTGGDLAVSVPDAHVLFGGDLLWRRISPTIVDSNVRVAIGELAAFRRMPDSAVTTFVPGHGELMRVGDVAEYQAHLADLAAATADVRKAGLKGEDEVEAVKAILKPRYGDWRGFDRSTAFEVQAMDEELAGTKRVPTPASD